MSRTSKKKVNELMHEIMSLHGVDRQGAQVILSKANQFFSFHLKKAGCDAVSLSPYRDNCWSLSAILPGEGCAYKTVYTAVEEFSDSPSELIKRVMGDKMAMGCTKQNMNPDSCNCEHCQYEPK